MSPPFRPERAEALHGSAHVHMLLGTQESGSGKLFEAGGSGNAEGLTVFDKRVVFPIGERLRADALSFEGPVLGHGRDGRGVACRENEAASKEGSSAEGFPSRPCAVSPARGARRKGANMDISQCLLCMNAPKGFRSLRRGSETCTAHKIQKARMQPYGKSDGGMSVRKERREGMPLSAHRQL